MLSPETPYPLHGGGALRTASLLHFLAQTHHVDLIVFRNLPNQDPARFLPPGLIRNLQIIDLPHHRRDLPSRVLRNAWRLARGVPPLTDRFRGFAPNFQGHYNLSVIEHFWCAEYQPALAKVSDRVVLNLHNVESALHATCAQAGQPLESAAHRIFAARSRQLEAKWLPRFHAILTASECDAARVRHLHAAARPIVYPNTIPFVSQPQRPEENVIAFSGNLEYHPNRTAVQFFAREVWPIISRRHPDLTWRLIGMNPHAIERDIRGLPRVETTGPVADAIAELAAAKVVVAPLRSGSGTRLKIIEAWAAARAVVSTTIGAEGLPATNGTDILIADSPTQQIDAIEKLLASPSLRAEIGRAGRSLFERSLSWEAAWKQLSGSDFLAGDSVPYTGRD